ncbi:YueI family protein [Ectobacillus ponti]|uniref:YueI family protein n=1 Tax=Ectobacillus ponti TaxID=2961894 RepID=A0AA41XAB6_9BACI|nr:YueI family protein [Ectobacillus ponti]MCP8969240.1 YueI family protein [Ectobacillus ponti]
MSPKEIEEYLQEGMYGSRENKPEERHIYLGSLRERAELALTKGQVMEPNVYPELESCLQQNASLTMLLNGSIAYSYLSKYIQLANKKNIPFTIVQNEKHDTPIGLLLAHASAVDRAEIFVHDQVWKREQYSWH